LAVGSDHAGFAAKQEVAKHLADLGLEVHDLGTDGPDSCDYPDYAHAVALEVAGGKADRGLLICKTGIGMSMAANKVPGVRAAVCHTEVEARLSRAHNDANVLCMGGGILGIDVMRGVVDAWLDAEFEGGRHARRVGKIERVEPDQ
jgi:ribose 5-phosphate isomerase B